MSEYAERPTVPAQLESVNYTEDKTATPSSEKAPHQIYNLADKFKDESYSVDSLTQANDLSVLRAQLSSDQIVNEADVLHTEQLIKESREIQEEESDEEQEDGELYEINVWSILQKGAINLVLPFINGMMLGFGEILAHEVGFRYGWFGAKVEPEARMRKRELERQQQQQLQQQQQQQQPTRSRFL